MTPRISIEPAGVYSVRTQKAGEDLPFFIERGFLMDKKKKREHYKQTLQSWQEYDEWTNHKYHALIKRKIMKNKLHYWLKKNTIMRNLIHLIQKIK